MNPCPRVIPVPADGWSRSRLSCAEKYPLIRAEKNFPLQLITSESPELGTKEHCACFVSPFPLLGGVNFHSFARRALIAPSFCLSSFVCWRLAEQRHHTLPETSCHCECFDQKTESYRFFSLPYHQGSPMTSLAEIFQGVVAWLSSLSLRLIQYCCPHFRYLA